MPALSETETERLNAVLRLDVRSRMLISVLASAAVIFFQSEVALLFLAGISLLYLLAVGRPKLVAVCYLATLVMWLLSIAFIYLLHLISSRFPMSEPAVMLIPFLRMLIMLNTVLVLALTSRVQTLLVALKGLHLPIWIYIPSAVVLRFIPDFIQDVRQIHETMRTRGYGLSPLSLITRPILTIRLLLAPMLFRALRSADELSIAAELKGIRHDAPMQSYRPRHFRRVDLLALLLVVAAVAAAIALQHQFPHQGRGGMM